MALCWPNYEIMQRVVAQIPWRSNISLLDKLQDKDRYLFDFLGTDMPRREKEIKRKLTEHIQKFLLELGQGFAFVWKTCDFEAGFIDQLNMYQNVVNDVSRHSDDKPTIGLLLVKGKKKIVVEYFLAGYQKPIGVAEWQNQIAQGLPDDLKSSLPFVEEIEKELE